MLTEDTIRRLISGARRSVASPLPLDTFAGLRIRQAGRVATTESRIALIAAGAAPGRSRGGRE